MAKKKKNEIVPQFNELIIPVVKALKQLGGSGTIEEISEKVYEIEKFSDEILQVLHDEGSSRTEVDYRLAWARTYLKKFGLIENSSRGIWTLADSEINPDKIDQKAIVQFVREQNRQKKQKVSNEENETEIEEIEESLEWKDLLLKTLRSVSSSAFERLVQRLLRESGFVEVEVTGRSGDGGIDGKGIVRISGFLSFHVIFQCKRYTNSVGSSEIRDFRGAMQGRADKGIFVTTGTFTRDARKEATRDGAPPLDLIDGEMLCEKLKELKLGVETRLIEEVEVKEDWFSKL